MFDLVTLEDVIVIESIEIEVGDSSYQFEMGESFHHKLSNQNSVERHKNVRVLEERFKNHIWGKEKRS